MSRYYSNIRPGRFGFTYNLLLVVLTAAYALAHLRWYGATAAGLNPVLDGHAMLELARALAASEAKPELFYVPPLYPALLSLWLHTGLSDISLPTAARALNLTCHLISTLCVAYLARRVWNSQRCGFVAGLLWGINPVVLSLAGDPLPYHLTICLLLLGTCGATRLLRGRGPHLGSTLVCALFWGLAALTASQAIVLIALCPFLTFLLIQGGGNKLAATFLALLICGGILSAYGYVNYKFSGEFRVTPWQNAYQFWAANRPGNHGRYPDRFAAIRFVEDPEILGRMESERAYAEQNPERSTTDYRIVDAYWRDKAWSYVNDDAAGFANRISAKFLYLLNNFEQFDNKTYSFHKQRSPWLAFNPLGWGILLTLAACGAFLAWSRPTTRLIVVTLFVYALGVVALFVNSGARLPLASLLAVLTGWVGRPVVQLRGVQRGTVITALVTTGVLAATTFIPLAVHERVETVVNDHIMMAQAVMERNQHMAAVRHAQTAVKDRPHHPPALEALCITRFRHWQSILPRRPNASTMSATLNACENAAKLLESERVENITAVYLWNTGNTDRARSIWFRLVDTGSEQTEAALQALIITAQLRGQDSAWLNRVPRDQLSTRLLGALSLVKDVSATRVLADRMPGTNARVYIDKLHAQFFATARVTDPGEPPD